MWFTPLLAAVKSSRPKTFHIFRIHSAVAHTRSNIYLYIYLFVRLYMYNIIQYNHCAANFFFYCILTGAAAAVAKPLHCLVSRRFPLRRAAHFMVLFTKTHPDKLLKIYISRATGICAALQVVYCISSY